MIIFRRGAANGGFAGAVSVPPMDDFQRQTDIETLARMAARLAGRDPDSRITVKIGDLVVFDNVVWCYPDFLRCAEVAYAALCAPPPPE